MRLRVGDAWRRPEAWDAALLVASELVTNALQHAEPWSDPVEVEVSVSQRRLHGGVYDSTRPPFTPSPRQGWPRPHDRQGGRRLLGVGADTSWRQMRLV